MTQKAQTTRNRITGIITKGPVQYVLLDTPGIHKPRNRLDSRMTQTAAASLKDVDVTLMLFEPTGEFTESELGMVEALRKAGPAIAVINKVDLLNDFAALEARKSRWKSSVFLMRSSPFPPRMAPAVKNCSRC